MNKLGLVVLSLYCFLNSKFAVAAVSAQSEITQQDVALENILSHGTINEGGVLRAAISLLIVILLIYMTAWIYKKLNVFNFSKFTANDKQLDINKFKLISTQSLGANKNLHVVEINGKYLVIGSTPNSINLIKEFDKNTPLECNQYTEKIVVDDLLDKYKGNDEDNAK